MSVHEVGSPPAQVRLFAVLKRKLDSSQSDEQKVESVEEKDEEEEPEAAVVTLAVRHKHKVHLVEVGDPMGQVMKLHLRRKQDHHQTAART